MKRAERTPRHTGAARAGVIAAAAAIVTALGVVAIAPTAEAEVPAMYAFDFLAPGSDGNDVNERGEVIGLRAIDEGCDPFCEIVPEEAGVWHRGTFKPLPVRPEWLWVTLRGINAQGWIVGTAALPADNLSIVWKPITSFTTRFSTAQRYEVIEIPDFPDTDFSEVVGIDDANRVVGYSYRISPTLYKGYLWTEQGGIVELASFGFPSNNPRAISPGGTVAYASGWYQLDVPGVVHINTAPPAGFGGPGAYVAINDTGDQVRQLLPSTGHRLYYGFRYFNTGEWQQIWPSPGVEGSQLGIGSVTSNIDISMTLSSAGGLVAPGPAQPAESATDRLSPAYGDATVYLAGPMTENGQMVGQVWIGRAPRLVRLVPAEPCDANCIRVGQLVLFAEFVDDPDDPGRCVGTAHTRADVRIQVTDETGAPLSGVQVTGHFLTVYRLNDVRTGVTDANGELTFDYTGAPCTGAMTFVVNRASKPGYAFDRTQGTLQDWMIPLP